jgi:hypothetical protein
MFSCITVESTDRTRKSKFIFPRLLNACYGRLVGSPLGRDEQWLGSAIVIHFPQIFALKC